MSFNHYTVVMSFKRINLFFLFTKSHKFIYSAKLLHSNSTANFVLLSNNQVWPSDLESLPSLYILYRRETGAFLRTYVYLSGNFKSTCLIAPVRFRAFTIGYFFSLVSWPDWIFAVWPYCRDWVWSSAIYFRVKYFTRYGLPLLIFRSSRCCWLFFLFKTMLLFTFRRSSDGNENARWGNEVLACKKSERERKSERYYGASMPRYGNSPDFPNFFFYLSSLFTGIYFASAAIPKERRGKNARNSILVFAVTISFRFFTLKLCVDTTWVVWKYSVWNRNRCRNKAFLSWILKKKIEEMVDRKFFSIQLSLEQITLHFTEIISLKLFLSFKIESVGSGYISDG